MSSLTSRLRAAFGLFALSCTLAAAQNPTFSLEAVAVNDVEIPGGPTAKVSVAPGSIVTFEVYVRNWSPAKEAAKAYQAQLDVVGYTSGTAGTMKPVDFENRRKKQEENHKNCYVDVKHPKFIFAGKQHMAMADTRSQGYRWLGLVLRDQDTVVCDQKGKKFYCGTVRMKVSDDAEGTFRPGLMPGEGSTTLRDLLTRAILPVEIEDALVEIVAGTLAIVSSDPPRWSIDARTSSDGRPRSWDQITLRFNGDTASLSGSDFAVTDGTPNPPRIVAVTSRGSEIRLKLNRGIAHGHWTAIRHIESSTETRIGCLPGDANDDGEVSIADLLDLLDPAMPRHLDVTGDGRADLADALDVLTVLTTPGAFRSERLKTVAQPTVSDGN